MRPLQRALPSQVIDAEVIIRDPPPYRDVLLITAMVGVLCIINPHNLSWREVGWISGPILGFVLVERILSRGWIRVGPGGISFGRWRSKAHYTWHAIDSFALGNPVRPEIAYVVLKTTDADPSTRPVRLPKLFSVSPTELVAELDRKRRLFAGLRGPTETSLDRAG